MIMIEKNSKSDVQKEISEIQPSFKPLSVLKLISNNERGLIGNLSFKSEVMKLKIRQLCRSAEEFEIDQGISYCKFVRNGERGCLIGVWQRNMDPASKHSSIYHLKFEYAKQCRHKLYQSCPVVSDLSCFGPFFKRMDITDSCEKNMKGQSLLLYVGNTAISGGRIVLNITNSDTDRFPYPREEMVWRSAKRIWSCSSNAYSERFAAGTEKGCFLFDLLHFVEIHNLPGDVLSVEFNKNGHLLYCGIDKEELIFCDLREDVWEAGDNQVCNRLGQKSVKEMKLLSDEVSMILSGTDGKMLKMDLRMKRPVFHFPEQNNRYGRRPFSVDEGLDLVCATGDDNLSRVWSLSTGKLLKSVSPSHQCMTAHACLVAEQRRWFIALVEANMLTPIFHY